MRPAVAPCGHTASDDVWPLIQRLLALVLETPIQSDFTRLQYTFLAQPGVRNDFRKRLATLYDEWRGHMAAGLARQFPALTGDPQLLASFVQALIHGLVMQLQADPAAFDRSRMLDLCVTVLGSVLSQKTCPTETNPSAEGRANA